MSKVSTGSQTDFAEAEDPGFGFFNLGSLAHNEGKVIYLNEHRNVAFLAVRTKKHYL